VFGVEVVRPLIVFDQAMTKLFVNKPLIRCFIYPQSEVTKLEDRAWFLLEPGLLRQECMHTVLTRFWDAYLRNCPLRGFSIGKLTSGNVSLVSIGLGSSPQTRLHRM
jgi:hypothetical protein